MKGVNSFFKLSDLQVTTYYYQDVHMILHIDNHPSTDTASYLKLLKNFKTLKVLVVIN